MEKIIEKVRLDKYLWSVRIFKTRALASEACEKGKVKVNEDAAKASRNVKKGDVYDIKTSARRWLIEVTNLLDNRVAFSEAILHYKDITPTEEIERMKFEAAAFHTGKRLSKIGRPTKKNKRDLDEFLENN